MLIFKYWQGGEGGVGVSETVSDTLMLKLAIFTEFLWMNEAKIEKYSTAIFWLWEFQTKYRKQINNWLEIECCSMTSVLKAILVPKMSVLGGSLNVTDLKLCKAYFFMFFNISAKNGVILKKKKLGDFFPVKIFQTVYGHLKMRLKLSLLL